MRLWSLHPSMLDAAGLVALWREGLLAQKVLLGETQGYRSHPQLERFRAAKDPVAAISAYLWGVVDEARARGYKFDASKVVGERGAIRMRVTRGQLEYELTHLKRKLRTRDRLRLRMLNGAEPKPHPILRVVAGGVEPWEIVPGERAAP